MKHYLAALLMAISAINATASDAEGSVRIVREVNLESGVSVDPTAVDRLSDGGFVIAGSMRRQPWAVKTDEAGAVQWRYVAEVGNLEYGTGPSKFMSAAPLSGGGVLLCGYIDTGTALHPIINGILVRLDKDGMLLGKKLVSPPDDGEDADLTYLQRCVRWGDGSALVGQVTHFFYTPGNAEARKAEEYYWVAAVGSDGTVKWQKLIPTAAGGAYRYYSSPQVLPNQDLVFTAAAANAWETEVLRVSPLGKVVARTRLPGRLLLVQPIMPDWSVELLSCFPGTPLQGPLVSLDADLHDTGDPFLSAYQSCRQAYRLPDHSMVIFGEYLKTGEPRVASTVWWDSSRSVHVPLLVGTKRQWVAVGAVQTGKPGEFAVAIAVQPSGEAGPIQSGVSLKFVQFKKSSMQ